MIATQFGVEFRKDGSIHDEAQVSRLVDGLGKITTWRCSRTAGTTTKQKPTICTKGLFGASRRLAMQTSCQAQKGRCLGMVRAYWPSKKFADKT